MLVLSRKVDEVIVVGDDVAITVIEIKGDRVRLGIEAPRQVAVNRLEVAKRIELEGKLNGNTNGVQLHGDSQRIVGREAKDTERPAGESTG